MAGATVDRVYVGMGGDHVRASASMGVVAIAEDEVTPDDIGLADIAARLDRIEGQLTALSDGDIRGDERRHDDSRST